MLSTIEAACRRTVLATCVPALLLSAGRAKAQTAEANTLTKAERDAGWQLLFDGHSLNGWRGYMRTDMPSGWQVVDGLLTRVSRAGDIITTRIYGDFELSFDFRVSEGGNSGIFYRAVEGPEYIYYFAPEYQILDDERHPDGKSALTSTGANYAVNEAPRGVTKPAGQWNSGRIVVDGHHVEHWLNGTKVVEYELGSKDWARRVAASKFRQWPEYGKAETGYIGIQDHGSRVEFRNIKIREIHR